MCVWVCASVQMCVGMPVHMEICVGVHVHTYVCAYECVCVCIKIFKDTHMKGMAVT